MLLFLFGELGYKNYLFAKKKFGMEENTNIIPLLLILHKMIKNYITHTYLMFLKFGFGRACQDACIEIRRGAMTRNQAIAL